MKTIRYRDWSPVHKWIFILMSVSRKNKLGQHLHSRPRISFPRRKRSNFEKIIEFTFYWKLDFIPSFLCRVYCPCNKEGEIVNSIRPIKLLRVWPSLWLFSHHFWQFCIGTQIHLLPIFWRNLMLRVVRWNLDQLIFFLSRFSCILSLFWLIYVFLFGFYMF